MPGRSLRLIYPQGSEDKEPSLAFLAVYLQFFFPQTFETPGQHFPPSPSKTKYTSYVTQLALSMLELPEDLYLKFVHGHLALVDTARLQMVSRFHRNNIQGLNYDQIRKQWEEEVLTLYQNFVQENMKDKATATFHEVIHSLFVTRSDYGFTNIGTILVEEDIKEFDSIIQETSQKIAFAHGFSDSRYLWKKLGVEKIRKDPFVFGSALDEADTDATWLSTLAIFLGITKCFIVYINFFDLTDEEQEQWDEPIEIVLPETIGLPYRHLDLQMAHLPDFMYRRIVQAE